MNTTKVGLSKTFWQFLLENIVPSNNAWSRLQELSCTIHAFTHIHSSSMGFCWNAILRCSLWLCIVYLNLTGLNLIPGGKITPLWSVLIYAAIGSQLENTIALLVKQLSRICVPLVRKSTRTFRPDTSVSLSRFNRLRSPPHTNKPSGFSSKNIVRHIITQMIDKVRFHVVRWF